MNPNPIKHFTPDELRAKMEELDHAETFGITALIGENALLRKENARLKEENDRFREDLRAILSAHLDEAQDTEAARA